MRESDKIKQLLHSGNESNIYLALQLIESMGMSFDFSEYEKAYYLLNHNAYLPDFDMEGLKWLLTQTYFDFTRWEEGLPIPDFIWELQGIGTMHMDLCGIEYIPASVGDMRSLDMLFLQGNRLRELPQEISRLQLSKLDLGSNLFEELPNFIFNITTLWGFDADNNRLKTLPDNIGNLIQVQEFRLYKNRLEYIPESIGNMKELIVLDLADNCLTTLPESIKYCSKLEWADLKNNPISETEIKRIADLLGPKCRFEF